MCDKLYSIFFIEQKLTDDVKDKLMDSIDCCLYLFSEKSVKAQTVASKK